MRYLFLFLLFVAVSCESHSFDSDKRQLIAKDEIKKKILRGRSFDITSFIEDTVRAYSDSTFKHPIRYTLDFEYVDSLGIMQKKKGEVFFTPDGRSVINAHIIDPE